MDFDLIVLGAGSGGLAAAKRAAQYSKRVAIIEGDKVGGTCVIRGCVPKKIMSFAAQLADSLSDAQGYGFDVPEVMAFDYPRFAQRRNAEVDRLNKRHIELLQQANVTLIEGFGRFVNPHALEVNGKIYNGKHIIIATGGRPWLPQIPGIELAISSDGVWQLSEKPAHMVIVGGGYIAVEFASIFNALRTEVHMVIRRNTLLGGFDADIRQHLQQEMMRRGVVFHCAEEVTALAGSKNAIQVSLKNGNKLHSNVVLMATGRTPNTDTLNLKAAGITAEENGTLSVSSTLQTNVEHIYAIGDITHRANLTPVAIRDGRMVAENLYNGGTMQVTDTPIATAVFTQPGVGTVGLSEEAAVKTYGAQEVATRKAAFKGMLHTLSGRDEKTLIKLVFHKSSGKILGCHCVARDAGELIQGFAVAVNMGATLNDLHNTVAIHPTTAEELVLL